MSREITRRRLLQDGLTAAAASSVVGGLAAGVARARTRVAPAGGARRRVAVLGGGMAGLAAAHELIERGFNVHVFERKSLGGKARSIPVAGTASGGRKPLPGEHGFRFFPGFYHHVPDTMRRVPYESNQHGVWDNLVPAPQTRLSRAAGPDIITPDQAGPPSSGQTAETALSGLTLGAKIPPNELAVFVQRVGVYLTSC